jgi:hypothetical protein
MKDKLRIPNLEKVPIAQANWLCDTYAVYEGAISTAQVGEDKSTAHRVQSGVIARDLAVDEDY